MKGYERLNNNVDSSDNATSEHARYDKTEAARQKDLRQQRKIIAAFLSGKNGEPNYDIISERDVDLPQGGREEFLDQIRNGIIQLADENKLIRAIESPVTKFGLEGVGKRFTDKHEFRILGQMSAGVEGFRNWQHLNLDNLRGFLERYPLPSDFERDSVGFLAGIEAMNGKQKRDEYEQAMRSFKQKVYGKRYEYWEQFKALNNEAYSSKQTARHNSALLGHESNPDPFDRVRGRAQVALVGTFEDSKQNSQQRNERPMQAPELEQSHEWAPGAIASTQVSKAQVKRGIVNRQELWNELTVDKSCQDSILLRPDIELYGVFDGVGGSVDGRLASQTVANVLNKIGDEYRFEKGSHLAWALNQANKVVCDTVKDGSTTASVAQVIKRYDGKHLLWASVGDSRIYIVDKNGNADQITEDEGYGRFITNALGMDKNNGHIKQFGELKLNSGDRVVICSDGITGDYEPDLMSKETIGRIVSTARTPREASINLTATATKKDDRTVVVFAP